MVSCSSDGNSASASLRAVFIARLKRLGFSGKGDKRGNPTQALASTNTKLIYPGKTHTPKHPLDKPEEGYYHLVRFIRRDCRLDIFGETFSAPPETQYEYVVATFDVKEQKLKVFLDTIQVEEYQYRMR